MLTDSFISLFSTRVCHVRRNYIQSHPDEEVAEQTMMLTLIHTAVNGCRHVQQQANAACKEPDEFGS